MPKRLHNLAIQIPTLARPAGVAEVSALFDAHPKAPAAILIADDGSPVGLVTRRSLRAGAAITDCLETAVAIVDGDIAADRAVEDFALDHPTGIEAGLIVTRDGMAAGYVEPARLAAFLARLLRRACRERDQACEAMREARDDRLRFLANMGHELRTPLNAVLGYADLMLDDAVGIAEPPLARRYVGAIRDGGRHLLNIINGMLELAKLDARSVELHEEALDPGHVAASVFIMLRALADAADVRLSLRVRPGLPRILADAQLLRQIMVNLLSNAIKFSAPGGRVTLSIEVIRSELRLVVQDQGPGIRPEDIETVMQPFKQLDRDPARRALGTGLGLPLVRAFVELHDGRFRLLSAEGKGTRAIVTLPAGRIIDDSIGRQQAFAFTRSGVSA